MKIPIFRSECNDISTGNRINYRYEFDPIPHRQWARNGYLWASDYPSGDEPFAMVEVPEGSRIAETNAGDRALFLPGEDCGMDAFEAYESAQEGDYGMRLLTTSEA